MTPASRITGNLALANGEFATVAQGAVEGMIGSMLLITLWLFLAVRPWRLIVPIMLILGLGLVLTLLFASIAVSTLNLISLGFGILFVGIAVDLRSSFVSALDSSRAPRRVAANRRQLLRPFGTRTNHIARNHMAPLGHFRPNSLRVPRAKCADGGRPRGRRWTGQVHPKMTYAASLAAGWIGRMCQVRQNRER